MGLVLRVSRGNVPSWGALTRMARAAFGFIVYAAVVGLFCLAIVLIVN